jgi:hypothetical protein
MTTKLVRQMVSAMQIANVKVTALCTIGVLYGRPW